MKNILVVSGHTNLDNSIANKTILDELQKQLKDVEIAYLDNLYPTFEINTEIEQKRILNADIIVLQFPLFWYGVPSIMHKWMEDVFVYGFSHGIDGDKIKGKKILISFTSGSPEELYKIGGPQNYPIEDFLIPIKQFATLCGMEWYGHIYTGGFSYATKEEVEKLEQMRKKALLHVEHLITKLNELNI